MITVFLGPNPCIWFCTDAEQNLLEDKEGIHQVNFVLVFLFSLTSACPYFLCPFYAFAAAEVPEVVLVWALSSHLLDRSFKAALKRIPFWHSTHDFMVKSSVFTNLHSLFIVCICSWTSLPSDWVDEPLPSHAVLFVFSCLFPTIIFNILIALSLVCYAWHQQFRIILPSKHNLCVVQSTP